MQSDSRIRFFVLSSLLALFPVVAQADDAHAVMYRVPAPSVSAAGASITEIEVLNETPDPAVPSSRLVCDPSGESYIWINSVRKKHRFGTHPFWKRNGFEDCQVAVKTRYALSGLVIEYKDLKPGFDGTVYTDHEPYDYRVKCGSEESFKRKRRFNGPKRKTGLEFDLIAQNGGITEWRLIARVFPAGDGRLANFHRKYAEKLVSARRLGPGKYELQTDLGHAIQVNLHEQIFSWYRETPGRIACEPIVMRGHYPYKVALYDNLW